MSSTMLSVILAVSSMIVGGVLTYVFGRMLRPNKRLAYSSVSETYIHLDRDDTVQKLTAYYDGEMIDTLHRSYCIIWNPSDTPIERKDISEAQPLRIIFPAHAKILDLNFGIGSSESVGANFEISKSTILLDFDLLNQRDFLGVEVYWTGIEESFDISKADIKLEGVVSGISKKFERYPFAELGSNFSYGYAHLILLSISITLIIAYSYLVFIANQISFSVKSTQDVIFIVAICALFFVTLRLAVLSWPRSLRLWFRRRHIFPQIGNRE